MSEAQLQLNLNPNFKLEVNAKLDRAVREVFQLDILPEAIKSSPVTPEGMAYNQATFNAKPHRPGTKIDPVKLKGTGHNRQSLEVDFPETGQARLFGQSGYSGYLEVGTSKMRAQPYIWPAWLKFKDKIATLMRGR